MTDRELRPAGRYEWEQILKRARLGALITGSGRVGKNGRQTRGGMTGTTFKAIALGWATWANDRGQEIWPGDATVAICLETTIERVATVRKKLIELGLLQQVRPRRGMRGTEYRLTIPSDLLDVVEVLTPAQLTLAAGRMRDEARGKPGGSGGRPTPPPSGGPPDHPEPDAETAVGGPADTPQPDADPTLGGPSDTPDQLPMGGPPDHLSPSDATPAGGSAGPSEIPSGGSAGVAPGGSAGSAYRPRTAPLTTTDHADTDLEAAVTVSRASPAAQDPLPEVAERCTHGIRTGLRNDGLHRCALCRVEARIATDGTAGTEHIPEYSQRPHRGHVRHLRLIRDDVA